MTIRIKLFAVLREKAGVSEVQIEIPRQATVAAARDSLVRQFPVLAPLLSRVAFAVNLSYAGIDTILKEGDELAILPPVSGG